MKLSISQKCSNFVQSTKWSDIPEKIRENSKYYFLDWMGALIAGSSTREASIIQELIKDQDGAPQANVAGLKQKTSVLNAALGNGYISHILEVDDLHKKSITHPAAPIDSAALSIAQMSKYLHTGKAAMNGVLSSLLAKRGYTGAIKIFEGKRGFVKAYSKEVNPGEKFRNLGRPFKILETSIKNYASCTHTHTAIDSVLFIMTTQHLNSDQIIKVKIYTYDNAKRIAGSKNPKSPIEAKFSLAYCVAAAIYFSKVGIDEFVLEKINNMAIKKIIGKIEIIVKEELTKLHPEKWPARVEIFTKNDHVYKAGFNYPRGSPENPLSCEELQQRFIDFSTRTISYSEAKILMEKILKIEEITNINQLFTK